MDSTIFNIERTTKQIFMKGQALPLNEEQFSLLQFFITYPKRVFSKDQLIMSALEPSADENTLNSHIIKIKTLLAPHDFISIDDKGYSFNEL